MAAKVYPPLIVSKVTLRAESPKRKFKTPEAEKSHRTALSRKMARIAKETSLDAWLQGYEVFAKHYLEERGLRFPTDWPKCNGDSSEWRIMRIISLAERIREAVEAGDAENAAWCGMELVKHYYVAFINDNLSRPARIGSTQDTALQSGRAARILRDDTDLLNFVAEGKKADRSDATSFRKYAKDQNLPFETVRSRHKRAVKRSKKNGSIK